MTAPGSYNANVVLSADIAQYQQSMGQAQQTTNQTTGAISKLGQTYQDTKQKVRGKFFEYDRASLATLAAATAAAALYQKQLSTLAASSAVTGQSMKTLRNSIDNTFKTLPVARGELVQLATTINQLGITSNRDIGQMVNIFTKLAAATGGSTTGLASSMIEFTKAMGDTSVGNVKAMSNSLVDLAAKEHLAAENIVSFANAIAPLARVSGITENQVLGLSTAFSKAGQDGFVAANTFNSMLEDITQLSSTGSPALAKYANVLGLTVDQFNRLPRAQALAELMQTISSQGQRGIATLDQLGINGVRAIKSIQAVAQSGGLEQLAAGGSTTGNQLDKGAGAAFNNLADSLAQSRNEMTQYGTVIGNQLIGPLNVVVKLVNSLIRSLGFLQPLLAAPIALMGLAGTAIAPALSVAAPFIAARWLRGSPLGRGLRYGFGMGRRIGSPENQALYAAEMEQKLAPMNAVRQGQRERMMATGMSEEEALRRVPVLTNTKFDQMGPIQRTSYRLGTYPGTRFGMFAPQAGSDQAAFLRGLRNYGVTAPLRLGSWIASANTNWYRNSMGAGGPFSLRTGPAAWDAPNADRFFRSMSGTGFRGALTRFRGRVGMFGPGEGLTPDEQGVAAKVKSGDITTESRRFQTSLRGMVERSQANIAAIGRQIQAEGETTKTSQALAREFGLLTRNVAELSGATVKASASVLGAGIRALPGMSMARGAAVGVGRFGFGLARDLFGSPLGTLMTAGLIGYGASRFNTSLNRRDEGMSTKYLNPIQKYNEQLGIASTNLADFSKTLQDAADNAKAYQPTSYGQVAQSMKSMAAEAPSSPLNAIWSAIAKQGNWQKTALNTLRQMPISDPRQLAAVVQDMLASGKSQSDVTAVVQQYLQNGGPSKVTGLGKGVDYRMTGRQVAATEGSGINYRGAAHEVGYGVTAPLRFFGSLLTGNNPFASQTPKLTTSSESSVGAEQLANALSGIQASYQTLLQTSGAPAATVSRLQGILPLFGGMLKSSTQDTSQGGGSREAIARNLSLLVSGTTKGAYGQFMDVLGTKKGQEKVGLRTGGMSPKEEDQKVLNLIAGTHKGQQWLNLQAQSIGLSDYRQIHPTQFNKMLINAQNNVAGMGGDFQKFLGAQGTLGKTAASSGVIQQAIGAMSQDTPTQYRAQQRLVEASIRQEGSLTKASGALEAFSVQVGGSATAMGQLALAAKQTVDQLAELRVPQMSRNQQIGYRRQQLWTANLNRETDPAGYLQAQVGWSQEKDAQAQHFQEMFQQLRDYDTQRYREQQDYQLQVGRSQKAFDLQQQYAAQDFQRQMDRAHRDYRRSLNYQARGAAQSIYDPFTRIQAKPTSSAGTLLANLADQNQAIQVQSQELRALKKMGLSTEAIQTLNLADPNNAQQLDRLFLQARDDPSVIIQLNAMTAKRIKLTRRLTQNDFNLQFQQTNQQFTQGLKDATRDYNTARDRAVAAQSLALFQMGQDYNTMVKRSARDLKTSMTELSNSLGTNFGNVMDLVTGKLSKYAPAAAAMIEKQLIKMKADFPELFKDSLQGNPYGLVAGGKGSGTGPTGTSASQPYGPGGPNPPGVAQPGLIGSAPIKHHHALGGISTFAHTANISEGGVAEAIIPLNSRGQQFMEGMYKAVSNQILKQQSATVYGGMSSKTYVDNSTNINGPITVCADDTKKMIEELARKQRISRLTKPAHAHA